MTFKKERWPAISHCFAVSSTLLLSQYSFPGSGRFRAGQLFSPVLPPAVVLKGQSYEQQTLSGEELHHFQGDLK